MKSKKKQDNPEVVVGDVAHKSPEPKAEAAPQPYLGGTPTPSLTKRSKVFIFVALTLLVLASAGWLYAHREKKELTEEQKLREFYTQNASDYLKNNNIKAPSGNINEEYKAESYEVAVSVADNYTTAKDYKRALQAYLAAEKLSTTESYTLSQNIATAYESLGMKKEAVEYYKKALQQAQVIKDPDEKSSTTEVLSAKIKVLQ